MTPAEFMRLYERRLASADFDQVAPLIADDAIVWFTDGSFVGKDAIRRAFDATWTVSGPDGESYWIDDVTWLADGPDTAVCAYRFHWSGTTSDGRVFRVDGRGTNVLRQSAGEFGWQLVHEHLSHEPASRAT